MKLIDGLRQAGVPAALGAAMLFGVGAPLAKLLLNAVSPWMLAGLLYLGSGVGLTLYRYFSKTPAVKLPRHEALWFVGAIVTGGIIGPILLMLGLTRIPASEASLLLNSEGVFTALLAWFAFKENFDRRIALGMTAIVAGVAILSWPDEAVFTGVWPSLSVVGACFMWAIDNNLTRKVSLYDATWIASVKGLVAGSINLALAFIVGATVPPLLNLAGALVVGFLAYGVSLVLFVVGLRHLGTARTGAYFSVAPFIGVILALAMGEPLTLTLVVAGALMGLGIWLHLTERHQHPHAHKALEHDHEHTHDEHHQHEHDIPVELGTKHRHLHRHIPMTHLHSHFPDAHHQHEH
ncbi:MAG: DMT family transporter [Methylobacter sp.]|nr:DMT family transporter [Methylobacter sp.]